MESRDMPSSSSHLGQQLGHGLLLHPETPRTVLGHLGQILGHLGQNLGQKLTQHETLWDVSGLLTLVFTPKNRVFEWVM